MITKRGKPMKITVQKPNGHKLHVEGDARDVHGLVNAWWKVSHEEPEKTNPIGFTLPGDDE